MPVMLKLIHEVFHIQNTLVSPNVVEFPGTVINREVTSACI